METDIELLNAARMMNQEALVKIFDRYAFPLYRYALRLCSDSALADQIVGDVFAKLLDQFSAGTGPQANLRSYLYETTYHRIIDEARYWKRQAPVEETEWLGQAADSDALSLEDQILFKQILDSIQNRLTNDQRHVIILRFLEGFSLRETATIMGTNVGHVKVTQSRGVALLRKALDYSKFKIVVSSSGSDNPSKPLGI